MTEPVDVHWETVSGHRYLKAGGWSLDPEMDTIESLRRDAEVFRAAADYLEREERIRDADREAERLAGYRHATGVNKSGMTGREFQERIRSLFEVDWRDYYSHGGLIRHQTYPMPRRDQSGYITR